MMNWMFGNYGMGYGGGMGFFMIFIWILIILGIIMLIKALMGGNKQDFGRQGPAGEPESAEEILKKRYARGEISEEEFKLMRDNLR
jgi:putative membrane protein